MILFDDLLAIFIRLLVFYKIKKTELHFGIQLYILV